MHFCISEVWSAVFPSSLFKILISKNLIIYTHIHIYIYLYVCIMYVCMYVCRWVLCCRWLQRPKDVASLGTYCSYRSVIHLMWTLGIKSWSSACALWAPNHCGAFPAPIVISFNTIFTSTYSATYFSFKNAFVIVSAWFQQLPKHLYLVCCFYISIWTERSRHNQMVINIQ